jgi:hypothetical protein
MNDQPMRLAALISSLALAGTSQAAPLLVEIGNGPDSGSTYINAGSLANTMAFTSVTVVADNEVRVAESVDLSTSVFGPTLFDLFLQAPTVTIDGTVKMSAGNISLLGSTVNLRGELQSSDGFLLDSSRISGLANGPTTINVDGAGRLPQAEILGAIGLATTATINVLGGAHPLDSLSAYTGVNATMSGGTLAGATISGSGTFDWTGGQILEGVLVFSGAFNIFGAAFEIAPLGDCALTPEGSWQAVSGSLSNQASCVRGIFADGSSFRTAINSIGTTNLIGVNVVPVPAAAWLLLGALGGLAAVRRRPTG